MLSIVLDKPENLETLTRCLSMIAAYRPSPETEVIVPWEGKPREILPVLKAFSSRFFWKLAICPEGTAGYLAACHLAKSKHPVLLSHRALLTAEALAELEKAEFGKAKIYKTERMLLEYDPYSHWLPDDYKESCLKLRHQTPEIQVDQEPFCVVTGEYAPDDIRHWPWVEAAVFILDGPRPALGKAPEGDLQVLSSTDKPCFPPDEDRV